MGEGNHPLRTVQQEIAVAVGPTLDNLVIDRRQAGTSLSDANDGILRSNQFRAPADYVMKVILNRSEPLLRNVVVIGLQKNDTLATAVIREEFLKPLTIHHHAAVKPTGVDRKSTRLNSSH